MVFGVFEGGLTQGHVLLGFVLPNLSKRYSFSVHKKRHGSVAAR